MADLRDDLKVHLKARLTGLRKRLNWSPADLARALGVTPAAVEGWEAGLWRPQKPVLNTLEMLEKGSALYYSAVDDDSEAGCPTWLPLQAESLAEARAEAEKLHSQTAGENKIIVAENRVLKATENLPAPGFRVAAVWSSEGGWVMSD
jgi:transcriptional regulator with XRE-family HTH domain